MNAIIIAAGSAKRISDYFKSTPKSLIDINGKPIINYQIEILKKNGINDIVVIRGKYGEKFKIKNINYVNDNNYEKHDILGSLMEAKQFLKNDVIVLYSDIIFENKIIEQILETKADISIAIDNDWEKNYAGRTEHPKSEAENVAIDKNQKIIHVKKNIQNGNYQIGEFLGIVKFTEDGGKIFVQKYEELLSKNKEKFHESPSVLKAYLTDMLQELIDCDVKIEPVFISGKWCEIDTMQDVKRAENKFKN